MENKDLNKRLKEVWEEVRRKEIEKAKQQVKDEGCHLSKILLELNEKQASFIEMLKKENALLEKALVAEKKVKKLETILAWVFVSGMIAIFIMGLVSMIYIIKK